MLEFLQKLSLDLYFDDIFDNFRGKNDSTKKIEGELFVCSE